MIDNELDTKIMSLQNMIHNRTNEIYRLQAETIKDIGKLQALIAERDEISGLKVRVMDSEIQMGVSYHGGRLHD